MSVAVKSLQTPSPVFINPADYHTPNDEEGWAYQVLAGDHTYFKYDNYVSCVDAYRRCPPVAAIINRKAQAFGNGKTWLLDKEKSVAKGQDADKFYKLWNKPNQIQSSKQFEAQCYSHVQLFGFNIILPVMPVGYTDPLDASSLWNIPASWIDWNATQEIFNAGGGKALTNLVISFNGYRTTFDLKDLWIIRDTNLSFNLLTFPESRINAIRQPINNIIGAIESRGVLINQRGAQGVLSSDPGRGQFAALPMSEPEKTELQRDFRRYGLRKKQWQIIMTTASLKWTPMGYATKDLMLLEEVNDSSKMVCDGLNFPPYLLGLIDPTFNNQATAEKSFYRNSVIPDAENIYDHWNRFFKLQDRGLTLEKDYSHIECLQADKKSLADARYVMDQAMKIEWESGLITLNQWLQAIGEDSLPDSIGDVRIYDVKTKNVPLAVTIGVGGVQGLISVVTAQGLSDEAKASILQILFGLEPSQAQAMAASGSTNNTQQNGQQNNNAGAVTTTA